MRLSQSEYSQMPQALRPSCSRMCRFSVSASCDAIWPPVSRPPTKERQPISGELTSTGERSRAAPAHERERQALAPRQRGGQGEGAHAAVGGRLGDDRVAGERLHEHGVHEDRQRVVPRGDVGHRAGQLPATREHRLDLVEVPLDAGDGAVDRLHRLRPRLADLPDQQQREEVAVGVEGLDGTAGAGLALGERHRRPLLVLDDRGAERLRGHGRRQHRGTDDLRAVDGRDRGLRAAGVAPGATPQVAQVALGEGLGGHRPGSFVGLGEGGSRLQREARGGSGGGRRRRGHGVGLLGGTGRYGSTLQVGGAAAYRR